MGEIVNLRLARKRAARQDREAAAQASREASGVPGRVRKAARRESERADAAFESHRLDPAQNDTTDGDTTG